jgi:hypothetical protein
MTTTQTSLSSCAQGWRYIRVTNNLNVTSTQASVARAFLNEVNIGTPSVGGYAGGTTTITFSHVGTRTIDIVFSGTAVMTGVISGINSVVSAILKNGAALNGTNRAGVHVQNLPKVLTNHIVTTVTSGESITMNYNNAGGAASGYRDRTGIWINFIG